jgi:AcrR family transcriptional regulator
VSKARWIDQGYEIFAEQGLEALKIERLAALTGVSKSSFYHHFADLELFCSHLFEKHLRQSAIIAAKERQAIHIDPDLIDILLEHKTDLLFNRQLRFNRQIQSFDDALQKSNALVGNDFVQVWVRDLSLSLNTYQLQAIFALALENFYLQINIQNLNAAWLRSYFAELRSTLKLF